jgi:hypothetical protein
MRWRLRDGFREVWIVDAFWDGGAAEGTLLSPAQASVLLRAIASDPFNADVLRDLQASYPGSAQTRVGSGYGDPFGGSRSPLAATLADVFTGKFSVIVGPEPEATAQELPTETLALEDEPAAPLVVEPEVEPEVPPDVLSQVATLLRAAQTGAPFCEECGPECGEQVKRR